MFNNSAFYKFDKSWLLETSNNTMLVRKNNVCSIKIDAYYNNTKNSTYYGQYRVNLSITTNNSEIGIKKYFEDQMSAQIELEKIFQDDIEL